MQWYYSKNGTQLGPIGTEDIQSKLASGEIAQSDLVWKDGMADWLPAGQIAELRVVLQATSPVAPAPSSPVVENSPYTPPVTAAPVSPVPYGGLPVSANCGKATAAMVLGICGIVFAICCSFVGVILGILAVIFGNLAKTEIAQNPYLAAHLGKAKSGVLMGWIAIALGVVMVVVSLVFNFSAIVLENMK